MLVCLLYWKFYFSSLWEYMDKLLMCRSFIIWRRSSFVPNSASLHYLLHQLWHRCSFIIGLLLISSAYPLQIRYCKQLRIMNSCSASGQPYQRLRPLGLMWFWRRAILIINFGNLCQKKFSKINANWLLFMRHFLLSVELWIAPCQTNVSLSDMFCG